MNKILVFVFDEMTDYQITFITHLLSTSGDKEVITIAYEDKIIKGRSGLSYKPDKLVADVINKDVEGLIICGGWYGNVRKELLDLINNLYSKEKLLGGICGAGTFFLAKAGILQNVKYTTPIVEWTQKHKKVFGEHDPFPRSNFVFDNVVRDKNVITAQGISFIDFAVEICDWFNLFENRDEKNEFIKTIKGL